MNLKYNDDVNSKKKGKNKIKKKKNKKATDATEVAEVTEVIEEEEKETIVSSNVVEEDMKAENDKE